MTRLVFRPTRAGRLRVGVMLGPDALGNGPLEWVVEPSESHADGCVVRGDGARSCVAGEAASFSVFTRDRFGNLVAHGGGAVSAEIRGKHSSPVGAHTVDLRTGEYRLSYTASVGGVHELHVFAHGQPVLGSPFTLKVHAARTAPAKCEIDASQLTAMRVGVAAPFRIVGYDRHKNRALRGGDPFRALLRPPDGAAIDIRLDDADDGTTPRRSNAGRPGGTTRAFHGVRSLLAGRTTIASRQPPAHAASRRRSASFLERSGGCAARPVERHRRRAAVPRALSAP